MMQKILLWTLLLGFPITIQAQNLNEQLIDSVILGKYDQAKKLVQRGARANYVQTILIKGQTRESYLKNFTRLQNKKSVVGAVAEVFVKAVALPFVLLADILTPRKSRDKYEYFSVMDYVLVQTDSPKKHEFIRWLYYRGGRPTQQGHSKIKLMISALKGQNVPFLKMLLRHGYSPRVHVTTDGTALNYILNHYPAKKKQVAARLFLNYGVSPLTFYGDDVAPLVDALKTNDRVMLKLFYAYLRPWQIKNYKDTQGLFEQAIATNDINIVKGLIKKGFGWRKLDLWPYVLTNEKSSDQQKAELVKYLINLNLKSKLYPKQKTTYIGKSLYDIIQYKKYFQDAHYQLELLQFVLKKDANPLVNASKEDKDPLTIAIETSDVSVIRLLLKYCKTVDIKNAKTNHVALVAKHHKDLSLLRAFIDQGFDWQKPLTEGVVDAYTYLLTTNVGQEVTSLALLKQLLTKKSDLNQGIYKPRQNISKNRNKEYFTPLALLYRNYIEHWKDSVQRFYFYQKAHLLIQQGANPTLDKGKVSMLDYAIYRRDWDTFRFLVKRLTSAHINQGNTNPIVTLLKSRGLKTKQIQLLLDKGVGWKKLSDNGRKITAFLLEKRPHDTLDQQNDQLLEYFLKNGAKLPVTISRINRRYYTSHYDHYTPLGLVLKSYQKYVQYPDSMSAFIRKAKILMAHGVTPFQKDSLAVSGIEKAIDQKATPAIKFFLSNVTSQQIAKQPGIVAYAVQKSSASYDIVKLLLSKDFLWDKDRIFNFDLIQGAIKAYGHHPENIQVIEEVLRQGANPDQTTVYGQTVLSRTLEEYVKITRQQHYGYRKQARRLNRIVDILLKYKANPMVITREVVPRRLNQTGNYTALHWAISTDDRRMVKKLLANISPEQAQQAHSFNLRLACERSYLGVVRLLVNKGFDWKNFVNPIKGNVLHSIIANTDRDVNKRRMLRYFINKGVNINHKDQFGMTPLMFAIVKRPGNLRLIRLLLKKGADVQMVNQQGKNVIQQAYDLKRKKRYYREEYGKVIKLLEKK